MVPYMKIKQSPCLNDIAANRCIHESGKQWHTEHLGIGEVRVGPRTDAAGRLKDLKRKSDNMEKANCLEFIDSLQFCPHHPGLNSQGNNQQDIVAGKSPQTGARHQKYSGKKKTRKQTSAGLFDTEIQEFDSEAR